MTKKYHQMMFTQAVRNHQIKNNSAGHYALDDAIELPKDQLGSNEKFFIENRDSFYIATLSSNNWPYMQHRGGLPGFVKVVSPSKFIVPDYRGNRQYISLGNLDGNSKASLFFIDYASKTRLKLIATVTALEVQKDSETEKLLYDETYGKRIERALEFNLEAYEWNCPKYITPRYSEDEVRLVAQKMGVRIAQLEAELAELKNSRID